MSRSTLIVFLKCPRAGEVKTRLASAIGAALAARLYRVLAEAEMDNTDPRSREYDRLLAFSPEDAAAEMESWFPGGTWLPQEGRDLGERMSGSVEAAFDRGAGRVAIIGSDVPWVSREHVETAFGALEEHDVVLGPALDGGYYLIALRTPRPGLFEEISWGSGCVAEQTLQRIRDEQLSVRMLETLPDVDTREDVSREWTRLEPLIVEKPLRRSLLAHLRLARAPRRLTLLSKAGCQLCDEMLGVVEPVAAERSLELRTLDITRDLELRTLYAYEIPILMLGGRELCRHRVTKPELIARLDAPF